jgi:hypothetical protein
MRRFPQIACGLALLTIFCGSIVHAQSQDDGQGPIAAPPKFEVKRIPSVPHPGPPPIPEQEIIRRFAANEDTVAKVYDSYTFTETVRIEELSDPGGKFSVSGDVYTKPDGGRFWRVQKLPESTLKNSAFSLEDVRVITAMPSFMFTTDEIANYTFLYAGQDKLDDLNTYVFQVKPKQLSRTRRYFEGAIWVDDQDFAIVKSYGKFVGELVGTGTKLPFAMFETYRENFQGKYWLPTYTNSDDYLPVPNDEPLHLRMVIHATDFKPEAPTASVSVSPAPAPSSSAAAPQK